MGKITVAIPDDLERKLRHKMIDKFGGKRGALQKAIIEAIKNWVEAN